MLGPIFVLKLKLAPVTLGRRIVAEMWLYPDGTRIVELSTKCLPGEGLDVALEMRDFLASKGIDTAGRAADQDEDGARVLLRRAPRRDGGRPGRVTRTRAGQR